MFGKIKFQKTNQFLNEQLAKKQPLIAVHRGSAGGNIIENTIPAYITALKMGGDILETDVVCSQDKQLYHFHSGMEKKNFGWDFDIKTCTSQEIKNLRYYNSNYEKTAYPVEKLEQTLIHFKNKCLINIDRAWAFLPEVTQLIEKTGTIQQVILKGPLTDQVVDFLQKSPQKFMYMPKVNHLETLTEINKLEEINIVGVEIKAETEAAVFFDMDNLNRIKKNNLFIWLNALTINDEKKLFAGYDDNLSILKGEDSGWGVLINKGADIIQTDWPSLLYAYRLRCSLLVQDE